MKRFLILHPFLLAAISGVILFVSMTNTGLYISPRDVLDPTLWAVVISLIIYLLAWLLTRDSKPAALITSLLVLGLVHLWYIFLAVIIITLFSMLIFKLVLKKISLQHVNTSLAIISLFLTGFYLTRFVDFIVANPAPVNAGQAMMPVMDGQQVTADPSQFPDIYYIILDGYGREDMLRSSSITTTASLPLPCSSVVL